MTLAEFLKSASITVSNKGVFKHQSENSTSLTDNELKELIQVERDRAESYTERFIDHMLFNAPTKFPEWFSNTDDDQHPQYESYTIDWVL